MSELPLKNNLNSPLEISDWMKLPHIPSSLVPSEIQIGGSHYKDMAIEPSIFIVRNKLGWYEGNAVKYICRHKAKGGKQDLEKAIHYLQLAIEELYKDETK